MFKSIKHKNCSTGSRRGIATVELVMAMPLIATAFVTLMFLAHASHMKNDDYQAGYLVIMSRHSDSEPPNRWRNRGRKKLRTSGQQSEKKSVNHAALVPHETEQTDSVIKDMFPATETWTVSTSQKLKFVPIFIPERFSETTEMVTSIYRGTGDPKNRPAGFASPSEDEVKELAMSFAAQAIGDSLDIDLKDIKQFQQLLTSLSSMAKAGDVNTGQVKQQIKQARDQAQEAVRDFAEELAKELAKSILNRDKEKIDRLEKQIELIGKALGAMN